MKKNERKCLEKYFLVFFPAERQNERLARYEVAVNDKTMKKMTRIQKIKRSSQGEKACMTQKV